jgi:hypothetical protein
MMFAIVTVTFGFYFVLSVCVGYVGVSVAVNGIDRRIGLFISFTYREHDGGKFWAKLKFFRS